MGLKPLGTALVVLTLAACSSQPRQPASAARATGAPPPAIAPAANLATAGAPAAADAGKPNAAAPVLNRKLVSAGYRVTTIKGEIYYCRTVDLTNTNFKKKVCLTEAQLREEERKTNEMQDQMMHQQASPSCMGPTCAG